MRGLPGRWTKCALATLMVMGVLAVQARPMDVKVDMPHLSENSTSNITTVAQQVQWCSDCGFTFDMDFERAFNNIPSFTTYFTNQMALALDHLYEVHFGDIAPSPQYSDDKPFVAFTLCSQAKDSKVAWLNVVQEKLLQLYNVESPIVLTTDQDNAISQLQVYTRSPEAVPVDVDITLVQSTVHLVPPDSNGLPKLDMTLEVYNPGRLPVTIFAAVCFQMDVWSDTSIALPTPLVVGSKKRAKVSFSGPIVPRVNVDGIMSSDINVHLVESSGLGEISFTTIHELPPIEHKTHLVATKTHGRSHLETIVESNELELHDEVIPKDAVGAQPMPEADEFELVRKRLHSQQTLPTELFPSTTFRTASGLLVFLVLAYTVYFAYTKFRNRTIAWNELVKKKQNRSRPPRYPTDLQDSDDQPEDFDCINENHELLQETKQQSLPVVNEVDKQHVWGPMPTRKPQPQHSKPHAHSKPLSPKVTTTPATLSPPAIEPPYTLVLDASIRIHPKRFESLWEEFVERSKWECAIDARPDANDLMTRFYNLGMVCMASGSVQLTDKYLFYAAEASNPEELFFCEIDIQFISLRVDVAVRTSRGLAQVKIDAFVRVLKTAVQELVNAAQTSIE